MAGNNPPEIAPEVVEKLRAYSWPGNVRQLRNCLERAVLLANDGRITVHELPPEVAGRTNGAMPLVTVPSPQAGQVDSGPLSSSASLRDVEKRRSSRP